MHSQEYVKVMQRLGLSTHQNGLARRKAKYPHLFKQKEDGKWYHLFDINEQDLAVKFGYDVQEQYWKVNFKGDCPESVKDVNELLWKFENEIGVLNNGIIPCGGILGDALYKSKCVQDAICKKKREIALCEAQELDAGITVIEEIVKGEEKE